MNLMKSYNERQRKERINQELDRTEFGFGAERCRRFYLKMIEVHKEMRDRFQMKGDKDNG